MPAEAVSEEELNSLLASLDEIKVEEKKEDTLQAAEAVVPKTNYAVASDVFFDSSIRKYVRVLVEYNLETGYAKIVASEPWADNQASAVYKANREITLKLMQGRGRK